MIIKYPNSLWKKLNHPEYYVFRSPVKAAAALFGGSICLGSLLITSNTIALSWPKSILLVERRGKAVVPAPHLQTLSQTALTNLNLLNNDEAVAKLFCSESEIVEAFGSLTSPNGALIGIPPYLNASSVDEVIVDQRLYKPTDEQKKMRAELKKYSVFSDSAKVYVISEGLVTVRDSYHYIFPSIVFSLCFMGGFFNGAMAARWFKLTPFLDRAPAYVLSFLLWCAIALLINEQIKEYLFRARVSDLTEECIDGGIEFYEQSLKRHEIIKSLFGCEWVGSYFTVSFMKRRLATLRERKRELA